MDLGEALYLIRTYEYSCDSYVFTEHSSRVYLSRNAHAFCRHFGLIARAVPQWRAGAVDVPRRHSIRASGTINYSANLIRNCVFINGKQLCFLLPPREPLVYVTMHSVQRLLPRERRRGLSSMYSSDAASESSESANPDSPNTPVDVPPVPQPPASASASSESTVSENGDLGVGDKATRPLVAAPAATGSSS